MRYSPHSLNHRSLLRILPLLSLLIALTAPLGAQTTWPEPVIAKPFGVQLKAHNKNEANLDQVKALGLNVVRRGLLWHKIETKKGEYNFKEYDELVNGVEARGMVLLATLALNNEKLYPHVKEPEGRAAFIEYVKATMKHYAGKPIIWEIWNEPNIATFWGKHGKHNSKEYAKEYYELVKALVPEMKKADPNCLVVAGSVSGMWSASWQWTEYIFDMGVLKTGIDGWSHHPYSLKRPEQHVEGYERLREMFVKAGVSKDFPIINSERGFSNKDLKSTNPGGGDVNIQYGTAGKLESLPDYQAWHLVRMYLTDLLCDVKLSIWYEWQASDKEGFPLIQGKDKKKQPAFFACQEMIKQLDGFKLDERLDLGADNDFALSFSKGSEKKLVVWTSPTGEDSPDLTKNHEASIPVPATGEVTVTGIYGKNTQKLPVQGGKVKLLLTGAPQYVSW